MADKFYIFTGTDYDIPRVELALDSDNMQAIVPGSSFVTPEHENTWHSSSWEDGAQLVRHKKGNRVWPIRVLAGDNGSSSEANDLADPLILLANYSEQARRYEAGKNVEKVGLFFQLDGATRPTYYDVKDIECNGSSLMDYISRKRGDAEMQFTAITTPWGYGDTESLSNRLKTPHFEEGAGTLANSWNLSGTPTTSYETTIYICGTQSQKIVTDSSTTEGIASDTITVPAVATTTFVAYVWVYVSSGDDVTLDVVGDVTGSLGTAKYNSATTTATGKDGNTWRRLEVIAPLVYGANNTFTIEVERISGDASAATTFYVDKGFLQFGIGTIPTAWSSYWTTENYYEVASGAINYLDVVDVPGDMLAETRYQILSSGGSESRFYLGNDVGALNKVSYLYKDNDGTADAVGNSSNGEYFVSSSLSIIDGWVDLGSEMTDSSPVNSRYKNKYILFGRIYNDHASSQLFVRSSVRKGGSSADYIYGEQVEVAEYQNWAVQQVGVIDMSKPEFDDETAWEEIKWEIQGKRAGATADVRLDIAMLFPADFCTMSVAGVNFYLSTRTNRAYSGSGLGIGGESELLGEIPSLDPIDDNRLYVLLRGSSGNANDNYWPITNTVRFTVISYTPRTSYLFGS